MSASMATVLLAHWAHNCSPDKCTCSCGESIKHWGDGVDANAALAAHQAEVLAAAGYGLLAGDCDCGHGQNVHSQDGCMEKSGGGYFCACLGYEREGL